MFLNLFADIIFRSSLSLQPSISLESLLLFKDIVAELMC